mmetsp:Transcript_57567/g.161504  ORF Transcript_57567/g.161504 Transcript_57567/m.161504 type:complete len:324 (-) Transcript_57567:7-978(-)
MVGDLPLATTLCPPALDEHVREKGEVGGVHHHRRADGDVLDVAIAADCVAPHCEAVDEQTVDHLGDLDHRDHWRHRFHRSLQRREGREEEVHVHERVHTIVCHREPDAWSVLGGDGEPTEEHHGRVVVPLQEADRLPPQDEEGRVAKLRNLREGEEEQGQSRVALPDGDEVERITADCKEVTLRCHRLTQPPAHLPCAPDAEQRQVQVPRGEGAIRPSAGRSRRPSRRQPHHGQVCGQERERHVPTEGAEVRDAPAVLEGVVVPGELHERDAQRAERCVAPHPQRGLRLRHGQGGATPGGAGLEATSRLTSPPLAPLAEAQTA